jgi:hypothetical protein
VWGKVVSGWDRGGEGRARGRCKMDFLGGDPIEVREKNSGGETC